MQDQTIEIKLTSRIKATAQEMRYLAVRPPQPTAAQPPLRPSVQVEVKSWLGQRPPDGRNTTYLDKCNSLDVPAPIRRFLRELLQLKELSRQCSIELAWVRVHKDKNGKETELVVYDCARSDRQAILHGFFDEGAGAFDDLKLIADGMARVYTDDGWDELRNRMEVWAKWSGFARHDVRIVGLVTRTDYIVLTIVDTVRVVRYPMGEYCRALPVPPFPEGFKSNPRDAVVVASFRLAQNGHQGEFHLDLNTWRTLERINEVVRSRSRKQTILLWGEPGAGKELYARAIHSLSCRPQGAELRPLSTASLKLKDLQAFLCGTITADGHHNPGYIAKAEADKETLMLDEFDKACLTREEQAAFYRWLLRILEAHEYIPQGGHEVVRYKDVTWILAGAFEDVSRIPPDFWSRLSGEVQLHGFNLSEEYVTAMFLYWWFATVLAEADGVTPAELARNGESDFKTSLVRVLLLAEETEKTPHLAPAENAIQFAQQFAQHLRDKVYPRWTLRIKQRKRVSARTIRQAAHAAAQSLLFYAKGVDANKDNIWNWDKGGPVKRAMEVCMCVTEISIRGGED